MTSSSILSNIHKYVAVPPGCKDNGLVRGEYDFYHYVVDGVNDRGWGCGYRSLQTLCSWVCYALGDQSKTRHQAVPGLREIQQILVRLEDKPPSFCGSKEWIGSYEVFLVLNHLYDVSCKILHVESGSKVTEKAQEILNHFIKFGSPVMIGGDNDASSKTLLGVCCTEQGQYYFLIADPHFVGKANIDVLMRDGWLQWKKLEDVFIEGSFYNFCLPQLRMNEKWFSHTEQKYCDLKNIVCAGPSEVLAGFSGLGVSGAKTSGLGLFYRNHNVIKKPSRYKFDC